jgi:hypothetical protein
VGAPRTMAQEEALKGAEVGFLPDGVPQAFGGEEDKIG